MAKYVPSSSASSNARSGSTGLVKEIVDYKEKLSPDDYELYLALHSKRNELAKELAIDKSQIFRNEETAEIAARRCCAFPY